MACTSYKLSKIETSCGSNIPSIKKMWVGAFESAVIKHDMASATEADYADVDILMDGASTPAPVLDADGNKIIVDIKNAALATGADEWVEFAFRKNTCSADTEMTVNDNGSHYFTNSVNMVFARQDSAKRLNIQALASGDCSVIYQDGNNNYWFIGLDQPVNLTTATATTGTAVGDSNQYDLVLAEESAIMPVPVLASVAETIISTLTGE